MSPRVLLQNMEVPMIAKPNMKARLAATSIALSAALLAWGASPAAARVAVGINFGFPGVVVAPPVYAAPPPVVYAPPPVYAAPPVVYAPGPVVGGYWYYDHWGHRHWRR